MTFTESVRTCLTKKYARFRDRASRSEFWWFVLFGMLASLVAGQVDAILGFAPETSLERTADGYNASYRASGPISTLVSLALLLPNLAVAARRLHDTGRSGWWLLLAFVPIVGWLILLWWYTRPSEPGPNAWGPSPLDPAGALAGGDAGLSRSRVPNVDRSER